MLFLNTICNLQQLRMFFNNFLNLVLVCKDTEPRYGKTRTRGFFSTIRVVSTCMLSINFLKHLLIKSSGYPFLTKISFKRTNSLFNLVKLEQICKYL